MSRDHGTTSPGANDRRLLRRASLMVAIQTALAVAAVVGIVIVLVYAVSDQARHDATEDKVRAKIENSPANGIDLVGDAPFVADGLPAGCDEDDARRATRGLPDGVSDVTICDTPFVAYATDVEGRRAIAVVSFIEHQEETQRLAGFSIAAAAIGVLAAAGIGWVIARRAVRPLGDALETQRRFVADAGHELRTPLSILRTRTQMLARGMIDGDALHGELRQLDRDSQVLTDVVNDMLLAAEMQYRAQERQNVDLVAMASEIRNSYAMAADGHGVDIVVDAEVDTPVTIIGLPTALRRAVAALVDNALDHVDEGGTISVSVQRQGRNAVLRVSDDGQGLDPAIAAELTQRFHRGPTATDNEHRLGLGLALVSEIVHAHGGSIDINGGIGQGASITLRLPRA